MFGSGTAGISGWESSDIDLVSISQALLVAECLSFRRAAKVLGVRQSAVSRRIRSLEDTLGVSLFERHSGGVRLTAAGAKFLDRARHALVHLDQAIKTAGAAGRGETGILRIGIYSSMASGFLRELIRAFGEHYPEVALQISEGQLREHVALIRKSRLDIAFVRGISAIPHCDVAEFWTERLFVALPRSHVLGRLQQVEWEALREERFIVRETDAGLGIHDYIIKRLAEAGYHPRVQKFEVGRETLVHLVALGMGVCVTTEATVATSFPDVVFRPIAGNTEVFPYSGVWSPSNDNPALRRFLSLARTLSKERKKRSSDGAAHWQHRSSTIDSISL